MKAFWIESKYWGLAIQEEEIWYQTTQLAAFR